MATLKVLMNGFRAGFLTRHGSGMRFTYASDWPDIAARSRVPADVSMSMPASRQRLWNDEATAFFSGLLPETDAARRQIGRILNIDASDDLALLASIGRDLPGAISVVGMDTPDMPDHLASMVYRTMAPAAFSDHLASLGARPLLIDADGELRLSLAGVNDKTSLLRVGDQWALPRGRTPSSHIIKTDIHGLPDSARTEHFCLLLAEACGLSVPRSRIGVTLGGQSYLAVARYDRRVHVSGDGVRRLERVHQEDVLQAIGLPSHQKYERDGGPTWADCFRLSSRMADPATDRDRLLSAAIFQFIVGNPDAHAKNYAVIHDAAGPRLSPLYDVNNAAAFAGAYKTVRPRMAMSIGGERDPTRLTAAHWQTFSTDIAMASHIVLARLGWMIETAMKAAPALRKQAAGTDRDTPLLDAVTQDVTERCHAARQMLVALDAAPPRHDRHDMAPFDLRLDQNPAPRSPTPHRSRGPT